MRELRSGQLDATTSDPRSHVVPLGNRIIYKHAPISMQLVWARSYAVGCGAFRCDEIAGAEEVEENGLLLVCYYGPG